MAQGPPQRGVVVVALGVAAALAVGVAAAGDGDLRSLLVVVIALALGATLLATDFGFAGAFRRLVESRDTSGIRAHLVAIAVAMSLMVPMIGLAPALGLEAHGLVRGIGLASITGGALFGIGMQLAGGCASGTLYQLGGGSTKHLGTLAGFVAGSVLAASHVDLWWSLPGLPPVTLFTLGPWPVTLAIELALVGSVFALLPGARPTATHLRGAVLLGLLGAAMLAVTGWPWSETWAFTLWGAQLAARAGAHPETWRIFRDSAWNVGPLVDRTSIADLGIPLGAMLAAGLLGRFRLTPASPRAWLAAGLGGLFMGYGARIAGGCNIGAYVSDLASGDLSGWVWAVAAAGGSALGLRARRRLDPRAASSCIDNPALVLHTESHA
jgi:uncharacterized membrane protein YedE/YeeE